MEHITKKKFAIATVAVMVVMITGLLTAPAAFASSEKPTFHLFIDKVCLTAPEECMPGSTVEYQLTLYSTCDECPDGSEALPEPVVVDVLPEGLEFLGAETVGFRSELYEEEGCFCVDTFQNGNEITFQGIERWGDEDYYDFMTNDHITITYRCKISEDADPGTVLENTASFTSSAVNDPVQSTEKITVKGGENPAADNPDSATDTPEDEVETEDVSATGDGSHAVLMAAAAAMALAGAVFACRRRKA